MSRRELPPPPLIAPTPSKTHPPRLPPMVIDVVDAANAGVGTAAAIPPMSNADTDRQASRPMETSLSDASRDRDPAEPGNTLARCHEPFVRSLSRRYSALIVINAVGEGSPVGRGELLASVQGGLATAGSVLLTGSAGI